MKARLLVVAWFALLPAGLAAQDDVPALPDSALIELPQLPDTSEAPARAEPDSIIDRLRGLEGYTLTEYTGERAEYVAGTRTLRLFGESEVSRESQLLLAQDSIVYREDERTAVAYDARASGLQAEEIEGEVMFYELDRARATVLSGRTEVAERGATWYVAGDVTVDSANTIYARESTYTSDDREEPQYHFQSDQVMVIEDRILVGRPARLYFKNVPVMWLPFVVQDLAEGRRSGLLTPSFGLTDVVRTSSGYQRSISNLGYYWAINQFMGAQAALDWRSDTYIALTGALQYRWKRRFLNGSVNLRQFWPEDGARQITLSTSNSWDPTERSKVRLEGNYASSSFYLRDITTDPSEATQNLRSSFSLAHRFDWGSVNVGGTRRQSVADDQVETTFPTVQISPQPITLFRSEAADPSWYQNAQLTLSGGGSRSSRDLRLDPGRGGYARQTDSDANFNQGVTFGWLSFSSSGSFERTEQFGFTPADSVPADTTALDGTQLAPGALRSDRGRWSAGVGYQQQLIGSTTLTPNLGISSELRADTASGGEYVSAPLRTDFGARLQTDIFGFFPGVGGYSGFRHKVSPGLSYTYSPQATQSELQKRVFGETGGRTVNRLRLTFNQTIEAKLREREEEPPDTAATDTAAADTTEPAGETRSPPPEARKVTLLSVSTSPFEYDFARAAAGEPGLVTREVRNTISSDLLSGLSIQTSHELFDRSELPDSLAGEAAAHGAFSPRLSSLRASFSFGAGSPLVGFLGRLIGLGRGDSGAMVPGSDESLVPDEGEPALPAVPRVTTATANPLASGGGPWRVSLNYSLLRSSRDEADLGQEGAQTLSGNVSFSPTRNWTVNWNTSYSISDGEFGSHRLNVTRNLYRWEANFSFTRTPYGNTSFSALVRLIDLPDLKFEHDERDIGPDRRQTERLGTPPGE
ncbi:MAG: putative LPS assembly protein LptD [Longimicrobiaceae bacterium]